MSTIQLDEIAPGATARMCVIENVQYLSIRDVLMHVCSISKVRANEKWRLLSNEVKDEVVDEVCNFQFPGKGNKSEPVITFKGALKLVMMVSGEKATLYRASMVKILSRYYAGDGTLTDEIRANAQSDAPIAQMARAALVAEAVPVLLEETTTVSLGNKRKMEELQIAKLETELVARQIENKTRQAEYVVKCASNYKELCTDTSMDGRALLIFKDLFLNMAMLQGPQQQQVITNGSSQPVIQPAKPISLSLVAGEMGLKIPSSELISLGLTLKNRYVSLHGKDPSKHDQLCDGRMTKVNSYMEADRPLVQEVLSQWRQSQNGPKLSSFFPRAPK